MGRPVNPRSWLVLIPLLTAMIVTSGCIKQPRKPVFSSPPSSQTVLDYWMSKNCKVGEEDDLEKYMRKFGQELTPKLIESFTLGPAESKWRVVEAYSRQQLLDMQQRIDSLGLSRVDADRIRSLDPAVYSRRAVEEFIQSYKSSALAGLAVVRTPGAISHLQKEANDQQSGFRAIAEALLIQIKKPVKPVIAKSGN